MSMHIRICLAALALWGLLVPGGGLLAPGWAQGTAPERFALGIPAQTVVKLLGNPTFVDPPDQDGKAILHYKNARVTIVKGVVTAWRNFDERIPAWQEGMSPIWLYASEEDVMAVLGFPPNALRYTGLVMGRKPIGDAEWTYSVGTFIFQDRKLVGWRNAQTSVLFGGEKVDGAREPEVGGTAQQVIAALGTPPTLTGYAASGDQVWVYPHEQVLVRDGRVAWKGVPQPRTPAEMPPVRAEAPPPVEAGNNTNAPAREDKGFITDPLFPQFRYWFTPTLDEMRKNNPNLVKTQSYRAMQDCLDARSWQYIRTQAELNEEYARGVEEMEKAFNRFLDGNRRRN